VGIEPLVIIAFCLSWDTSPGFAHQRACGALRGRTQLVAGMNSISLRPRIAIPNFEPNVNGADLRVAPFNDSDPSKLAGFPASASSAKIVWGGALMTRSTLTVSPCIR
jgi:hypothetical protein